MTSLAFFVFCLLLFTALPQAVFAGRFAALLRGSRPVGGEEALPRAAILLSLRGADPQLAQGLRCLLRQDYPDYELHVVVDRRDDPTWQIVQDAAADAGRVPTHVAELREPLPTCSRKCSALVQMVSELDESREVVVLTDADVLAHPLWLRQSAAPLSESGVGAAFGNRWFMPSHGHWGSLVRYLWNVAAVVPMWLCNIPWGGTLAIRAKLLHECGLAEKWARAVVEDVPVRLALAEHGLRVRFVPSLMMVNREDCTFRFSFDFVTRQLTWARLYHPNWPVVVVHAACTTAALAASLITILGGWAAGNCASRNLGRRRPRILSGGDAHSDGHSRKQRTTRRPRPW